MMELRNSALLPSPRDQALARLGFKFHSALSSGIAGALEYYAYSGDNDRIKNLTNEEGLILIKRALTKNEIETMFPKTDIAAAVEEPDNAELPLKTPRDKKIGNVLRNSNKSLLHEFHIVQLLEKIPLTSDKLRPLLMTIEVDDLQFILSKPIPEKNIRDKLRELGEHQVSTREAGHEEIFDEIFARMYLAMEHLHNDGFLHFDLFPRNFIWPGIVVDLGLSLQMDENGNAIDDPMSSVIPAYGYNNAAKDPKTGKKTIHTDLYCMKICLIECLLNYMQATRSDIDKILATVAKGAYHITESDNESDYEEPDNESASNDSSDEYSDEQNPSLSADETDDVSDDKNPDIECITAILEACEDYVNKKLPFYDTRKPIVMNIINKYRSFLCSCPTGDTLTEVMQSDRKDFDSCNARAAKLDKNSNAKPASASKFFVAPIATRLNTSDKENSELVKSTEKQREKQDAKKHDGKIGTPKTRRLT